MTDTSPKLEERTVGDGFLVHVGGIPMAVVGNAVLATHPANWPLALETLQTEPCEPAKGGTAGLIGRVMRKHAETFRRPAKT